MGAGLCLTETTGSAAAGMYWDEYPDGGGAPYDVRSVAAAETASLSAAISWLRE